MRKVIAGIGFRTKIGKAIGVALSSGESPEFLQRWYLELYDPAVPATGQPHHEVMELPWPEAQATVRRYEKRIEDIATEHLKGILEDLRSRHVDVRSLGVVGSPDRNLEKIGNRHIRAHAAEGMLYRHAMEIAAARCRVRCRSFSDRQFGEFAARELKRTSKKIDVVLRTIGTTAGRPWRVDERAAAMAAWIVL